MESRNESAAPIKDEFDPIDYIEKAFVDGSKKSKTATDADLDLEIPSISEFLGHTEAPAKPASNGKAPRTTAPKKAATAGGTSEKLSAPRPRKVRANEVTKGIDQELHDVWANLPKNIEFLSSFFDDKVTSNYYRGEFKESRQELIQRLLNPSLTLEEVSRLLGVCPATVRRYTNRGWLAHHRTVGGQRRFHLSGVINFVQEHGRKPH